MLKETTIATAPPLTFADQTAGDIVAENPNLIRVFQANDMENHVLFPAPLGL